VTVLELIDYPVYVKLGCFEHERVHGQEVLVSIKASLSRVQNHHEYDSLQSTLDYGLVVQFIEESFAFKSVRLIETIIKDLGGGLLENFEIIEEVTVCVEKTILPGEITKKGKVKMSSQFARSPRY